MRRSASIALSLAGLSLFAGAWAAVAATGIVPETILPAPAAVARRAIDLLGDPLFQAGAAATGLRWAEGFLSGALIGYVAGVLIGSSPISQHLLLPLLDFLRSIPVTIAFPAFLLAFGLSDATNVAMAFAATVFLVTLNVTLGAAQAAPARVMFFRAHKARWIHRLIYLYAPEAIPNFIIALRSTVSLALIVVLVSEMFIGANIGIGQMAYNAYLQNEPVTLFAIIIWVGVVGAAANALLAAIPSIFPRIFAWR